MHPTALLCTIAGQFWVMTVSGVLNPLHDRFPYRRTAATYSRRRPIQCYSYHMDCDKSRADAMCDNGIVKCEPDISVSNSSLEDVFCSILWRNYTVVKKMCYQIKNTDCLRTTCIGGKNDTIRDGFCCCNTSECNSDYAVAAHASFDPQRGRTDYPYDSSTNTLVELRRKVTANGGRLVSTSSSYLGENFYFYFGVVPVAIVALALAVACYRRRRRGRGKAPPANVKPDALIAEPCVILGDAGELFKSVKLVRKICSGRFGAVWRAQCISSSNSKVIYAAVKILSHKHRPQWMAERDVYAQLSLQREHLACYLGSAECHLVAGVPSGLWLATAFCENGSVRDYIGCHTLTVAETCRIAQGTARGLVSLHEFATVADARCSGGIRWKPSIAHRDLKSANVLLTENLTARLADFGLAVRFDSPALSANFKLGTKLPLVGTLRYMAPEILEGAVDYTREALLQADMYSFGLVLWELISRTEFTDDKGRADDGGLAVANVAQPYRMPLEKELGLQPTLAAMQEAVASRRVRPIFEEQWLQHPVGLQLCDTAADCWDHEPAARISSSCAEQRLCPILISLLQRTP